MNNLRLLTRLLVVALLGGGMRSYGQSVITLEEIFEAAEVHSAQLRPSLYKSNRSLAKSRAATKRTVEELAVAQENLTLAVRADHIRYLEAYEEWKTRQKGAELAERNYRTIATRYSADMALITDMLDAANAKLDAEEQLANARIHIIYYYYKLLFITGKI